MCYFFPVPFQFMHLVNPKAEKQLEGCKLNDALHTQISNLKENTWSMVQIDLVTISVSINPLLFFTFISCAVIKYNASLFCI